MKSSFPEKPPRPEPSPEEKTRLARRFRRRACLADGLALAGLLLWLVSEWRDWGLGLWATLLLLAACVLVITTYTRCPCCGHLAKREEGLTPFFWRGFECPVCGFMPDWSRE